MKRKATVLICDDDKTFHIGMKHALRDEIEVRSAYDSDEALAILRRYPVDVLVLDIQMRTQLEGLEMLPQFRALDPQLMIVMNTSNRDYSVLRRAFQLGANDYLVKDADSEAILITIQQVLERRGLLQKNSQLSFEASQQQMQNVLVGHSPALQEVRRLIGKFRNQTAPVVIFGETGSGKEIVARSLRKQLSDGSWEPFVAIDSATIQSSTAESILFGYEKGAFTGADRQQKGIFEEADGGVVYFDEIANMPLEIQNKLLRAIQEKEILRLGSSKPIQLDFRVICATNRDLRKLCEQGLFKEDLYQRLHVLPISLAPLRERREDIRELAIFFVQKSAQNSREPGQKLGITDDALRLLESYHWPGNIRELSNVIDYAAAMVEGNLIDIADLPPHIRQARVEPRENSKPGSRGGTFYEQVAAFEKMLLAQEFTAIGENVSQLAIKLGMDRSHLHSKLKEYGIEKTKKSER